MKRITTLILIFAMLLSTVTTASAAKEKNDGRVVVMHSFNGIKTNTYPSGIESYGKNIRVTDRVIGKDKALYLQLKDGNASVSVESEKTLQNVGISFDINLGEPRSDMKVTMTDGAGGEMMLLKADSTQTSLYNSYGIKGIAKGWQNIQIIYLAEKKSYSVYVNGKNQISDWVVTSDSIDKVKGFELSFSHDESPDSEAAEVMADNLCIFEGTNYLDPNLMKKEAYNNSAVEFLPDADSKEPTKVYVSNDFEKNSNGVKFTPNDNICAVYKDEISNNSYINMERAGSKDIFFDISGGVISSAKIVFEVSLKYSKSCYTANLAARSTKSASSALMNISNGTCSAASNGTLLCKLSKDDWTKIAIAYNMNTETFDFYTNGEKTASNIPAKGKIDNISFLRFYGNSGGGKADLQIDNIALYSGSAPDPSVLETNTGKGDAVTNYSSYALSLLNGTITLSDYSDEIFYNGEKHKIENPVFKSDGQLMIPSYLYTEVFNIPIKYDSSDKSISVGTVTTLKENEKTAISAGNTLTLKSAPVTKDGVLYIGVEDMIGTIFGKTVTYPGRGLTVISLSEKKYSDDETAKMSNYMIYDHPNADRLISDFEKNNAAHPHILASRDAFEDLKENWQNNKYKKAWGKSVISTADVLCKATKTDIIYNPQVRGNQVEMLETCRKAYRNAQSLSMAYWLTGDKKYIDRLWMDMESASEFPDWNPKHPLDVSEMSMAFAIAYDWCYDAWTDEQKAKMEKAMLASGIEPYLNAQYGGSMSWTIVEKNNRGIVNNTGAAAAAMAIFDKSPEKCGELISNALWGIDYPMECFYPVGEWWEGSAYWGYALDYMSNFLSSTVATFGTDYNKLNAIGLDKTAKFAMYSMGAKEADNFHDAASGTTSYAECVYYLSSILNDADSANVMLTKAPNKGGAKAMLWYDANIGELGFDMPNDMYFDGEDQYFSMRSSWNDDSATILMGHAGQGEGGHSHMDTGTFVLDMLGERWAADLGSDSYSIKGLDSKDTRYLYYRYSPQGHNCLVINPGNNDTFYDIYSFCSMERYEFKEKGGYVIYDMTPAQVNRASKARRGFKLDDNRRSAIVRDEVTLTKSNSDVYWFMQTNADIEIQPDNSVILSRSGKKVKISFITDADEYTVTSGPARPLDGTSDFSEQNTNDAYKRIAVKMKASGSMYIQAKFTPVGEPSENSPNENISLDNWTAPDGTLETIPVISDIKVNGKTITGFEPTKVGYEYVVEDINNKPAVSASCENGLVVTQEENGNNTEITVKTPSGEMFRRYVVVFKPLTYLPDIEGMTRLPVYDIVASSEPEDNNPKSAINDNNINTHWTSNGDGENIVIDLGKEQPVDAAAVSFYTWGGTRTYSYDICVSSDNNTWTVVKENAKSMRTDDGIEVVKFDRVNARYVKFVGHCSTVNNYNNLNEFAALQNK